MYIEGNVDLQKDDNNKIYLKDRKTERKEQEFDDIKLINERITTGYLGHKKFKEKKGGDCHIKVW